MPDTNDAAVDDGPETDGCAVDFNAHADDPLTASLRPLFPEGDPAKADEWRELHAAGLIGVVR